jgi:hypothetical protein
MSDTSSVVYSEPTQKMIETIKACNENLSSEKSLSERQRIQRDTISDILFNIIRDDFKLLCTDCNDVNFDSDYEKFVEELISNISTTLSSKKDEKAKITTKTFNMGTLNTMTGKYRNGVDMIIRYIKDTNNCLGILFRKLFEIYGSNNGAQFTVKGNTTGNTTLFGGKSNKNSILINNKKTKKRSKLSKLKKNTKNKYINKNTNKNIIYIQPLSSYKKSCKIKK